MTDEQKFAALNQAETRANTYEHLFTESSDETKNLHSRLDIIRQVINL
jgi:hypothetical protein